MIDIAAEIDRTPSQVAVNWVRQQPGVILPLIGARTVKQLEDNLGALEFELSADHLARLDRVSRIELGFPHDFVRSDGIRDLVFGGTLPQLDVHRYTPFGG